MRKMILLASALALGGVAYAQDTTAPASTAPAMSPDSSMPPMAPTGADAGTPATPDASAPAMTPDASAPASPDAGMQGGMQGGASSTPPGSAMGPSGPVSMTPTQGPTDLPPCSKSVTDNCKQAGGGAKAMRHKRHK